MGVVGPVQSDEGGPLLQFLPCCTCGVMWCEYADCDAPGHWSRVILVLEQQEGTWPNVDVHHLAAAVADARESDLLGDLPVAVPEWNVGRLASEMLRGFGASHFGVVHRAAVAGDDPERLADLGPEQLQPGDETLADDHLPAVMAGELSTAEVPT